MFLPSYGLYIGLIIIILLLHSLSFVIFKKKESLISPRKTELFIFCLAFLIRFSIISFFPFGSGFLEKLPIIFFDSLIAVVIYKITEKKIPALVYSVNAIPIAIGALFGQFDTIVLFFIIHFLYLFKQRKKLVGILSLYTLGKWIILIVYIISGGLSIHYFLWIFPFALVTKDKLTKSYMLICGGFIILVGLVGGVPQIIAIIASQFLWLFFLLWMLIEIRKAFRQYILNSAY